MGEGMEYARRIVGVKVSRENGESVCYAWTKSLDSALVKNILTAKV